MDVQFTYKLANGTPVYDRPDIRRAYLENVEWVRGYEVHRKSRGPGKTPPQLAYYYGVIIDIAMAGMKKENKSGIIIVINGRQKRMPIVRDVVDWILKDAYAKSIGKKEVLKRNMSKMECMALIDFVILWCARYLHIIIPEPDVNWKDKKTSGGTG